MDTVVLDQRKRIHPHKFTLWIGIASIIMMFAGLTSAYIVKRSQAHWVSFSMPVLFTWSTFVIIVSSITLYFAQRNFFRGRALWYKSLTAVTFFLGLLFIILQYESFLQLWQAGITLTGNVSFSFLYVIVGLHALHVTGGIIALSILLIKSFSAREKNYNIVPVEVMSTYWHFVDILWIYLFIFLLMIR